MPKKYVPKLEQNPDSIFDRNYVDYKNKLKQIYEGQAKGVNIRSKSEWYEIGKNSSKFFLDLEKQHALLNQVRTLLCGEKEVTDNIKLIKNFNVFTKISLLKNWNFIKKI